MMIGLTSEARCGKNTVADYLSEEYNTATFGISSATRWRVPYAARIRRRHTDAHRRLGGAQQGHD
jgi:dephospho-CoA kinase